MADHDQKPPRAAGTQLISDSDRRAAPAQLAAPPAGPPRNTRTHVLRETPAEGSVASDIDHNRTFGHADGEAVAGPAHRRPGDRLGRYVLEKKLGEGAHGQVFRAKDTLLETHEVAIKTVPFANMSPEIVRKELETLATVGHPNIVALIDHGVEPDLAWFAMPFYGGQPLDNYLETRGPLTVEEAYDLFRPLASALASLHHVGFRHQDIKPENVFLAKFPGVETPHPLLLDLGVATRIDQQGIVAGTREYMAPEQLYAFERFLNPTLPPGDPLSGKMDVYSLAATLLTCLTRHEGGGLRKLTPDFQDMDLVPSLQVVKVMQADRAADPLPPGTLPDLRGPARVKLERLFKKWFGPERGRPSASEFAAELDVLLERQRLAVARRRFRTTALIVGSMLGSVLTVGGVGVAMMVGAFQTSIAQCEQRVAEKAKQSGDYVQDIALCNAQRSALGTDLTAREGEVATLSAARTSLIADLTKVTKEREDLAARLDASEKKLTATEVARDTLTKETALTEEKATLTEQKAALEKERDGLVEDEKKLKEERDKATEAQKDAEKKAEKATEAAKKAEADLATVTKERDEAAEARDRQKEKREAAEAAKAACDTALAAEKSKPAPTCPACPACPDAPAP